ncbi:MAG TPA: tail fiber protein [Rubricoccaceae bacterium]|jgi:microcystin-dependent protein
MPPYIGEIRMFAGSFAPNGWAFCDGQPIPISENDALFTLIGTTYGGDGEVSFNLPDFRGRIPVHPGNGVAQAEVGGVESVTLTIQQIPVHTHPLVASTSAATEESPEGNLTGQPTSSIYDERTPFSAMSAQAVTPTGGSQPHDNMQPYGCIHFIISLYGIFPQQT